MKISLYLISFIISILAPTHDDKPTKDKRALLEIHGRVDELSVSPDEKLWIVTATGNSYYANSIDSNWHYGPIISSKKGDYSAFHPNFDRVSFFNKDTAIITGYISYNEKSTGKNGLYRTTDGGKTWNLIKFGKGEWIYDVYVGNDGKAWMGGSSGSIIYTADYGLTWDSLNTPYDAQSRMHSIFMADDNNGIAGALKNFIYTTNDNWKTYKRIETPFDQNKYEKSKGYSDNRIEKLVLWNNYIVVNQNGHIFYTQKNKIDWKTFPTEISLFQLNNTTNKLVAINKNSQIITFSLPTSFAIYNDSSLYASDIKVVNNSVYLFGGGYSVYKVTPNTIKTSNTYTTDEKIKDPTHIEKKGGTTWGAEGYQIYIKDEYDEWYREKKVDFYIRDIKLIDDNTAILWSMDQDNYIYSLDNKRLSLYHPTKPIDDFLQAPISKVSIKSGSRGCFHNVMNSIDYFKVDTMLVSSGLKIGDFFNKDSSDYKNTTHINGLKKILADINSNPEQIPSISDFNITKQDVKDYLKMVDKLEKSDEYSFNKKKIDKEYYRNVPNMLDTLKDKGIIKNVLSQKEGIISTSSSWFAVELINENNDTIVIIRNYFHSSMAWHLPWVIKYKGLHFNCYSLELSKFINNNIPDNFMEKDFFNNSQLIMEMAHYFYQRDKN